MARKQINHRAIQKLLQAIQTVKRTHGHGKQYGDHSHSPLAFANELIQHLEKGDAFDIVISREPVTINPNMIRIHKTTVEFSADLPKVTLGHLQSHYDAEGDRDGYEHAQFDCEGVYIGYFCIALASSPQMHAAQALAA